jgi:hypothetical protein
MAVVLPLIVNIRNAWDLMLTLSRRRVEEEAVRSAAHATPPP